MKRLIECGARPAYVTESGSAHARAVCSCDVYVKRAEFDGIFHPEVKLFNGLFIFL